MKGVIYARYSAGPNQTEQSIEGQLRDCYQYAKSHDITIVEEYIDRHISGKTDNREQFQRMMKDCEKKAFDVVLMWKIDRFSRNRYDSAIYKAKLKKYGVKILYAKESIPEGPEGIILESLLEGMAEYYSAELSEKIRRGMRENAYKGLVTGGYIALGYQIGEDKTFQINEQQAPVVEKIFTMYDQGKRTSEICEELNAMGLKTAHGARFNKNSLRTILKNKKYIGIYESQGIQIEGGVPAIIDKDLFDRVQKRIADNTRSPGRYKAHCNYLLSGKLYCGECNAGMTGVSGTSKTGSVHNYYICINRQRSKTCLKKSVRKDWIENLVVEETTKHILQPGKIDEIANRCVEIQDKENQKNTELDYLHTRLAEVRHGIDNLVAAVEKGIVAKSTSQRLAELEEAEEKLQFDIQMASVKIPRLTKKDITFMLSQFQRDPDEADEDYKDRLIETFVSSVYLSDELLIIEYHLADEKEKNGLERSFFSLLHNPEPQGPSDNGEGESSYSALFGGGEGS